MVCAFDLNWLLTFCALRFKVPSWARTLVCVGRLRPSVVLLAVRVFAVFDIIGIVLLLCSVCNRFRARQLAFVLFCVCR